MSDGLLDDITVVDLSGITAGGRTTQALADFGANVIKVESFERSDTFRNWTAVTGSADEGDLASPPFRVVGRNKRALAVDLRDPRGHEIARRLVQRADLVVENFRRGVLEKLDLGYERLAQWNPRIVLLSLSSQGSVGPFSGYISYGVTLEALGGMMSVTGYGDGRPIWSTPKVNYPDQAVAMLGPALAVWGVRESRRTGRGCWIDLSQRELVTALLGERVLHTSITGEALADPAHGLGGNGIVVRAKGSDDWIAVTASSADERQRLHRFLQANDARVGDESLAHTERLLAAWARQHDKHELMRMLQAQGIACAAVLDAGEVMEQAATRADGLYVQVPLPAGGHETQVSWAFQIEPDGGARIRRRAPHIGEHSLQILASLGYDEQALAELIDSGVVHQSPADAEPAAANVGEALR